MVRHNSQYSHVLHLYLMYAKRELKSTVYTMKQYRDSHTFRFHFQFTISLINNVRVLTLRSKSKYMIKKSNRC